MSPARSKKAASASRKAAKKAGKPSRPAKSSGAKGAKRAKAAKKASPKARPPGAKPTAAATGHAHCAATDPFGDVCQNLPRRPSKYCVIHSYLER